MFSNITGITGLPELLSEFSKIKIENPSPQASNTEKVNPPAFDLEKLKKILEYPIQVPNAFFEFKDLTHEDREEIKEKKRNIMNMMNHADFIHFCEKEKDLGPKLLKRLIEIYSIYDQRPEWKQEYECFKNALPEWLFRYRSHFFTFSEKRGINIDTFRATKIGKKILASLQENKPFTIQTKLMDKDFFNFYTASWADNRKAVEAHLSDAIPRYENAVIQAMYTIRPVSLRLAYLYKWANSVEHIEVTITNMGEPSNCTERDFCFKPDGSKSKNHIMGLIEKDKKNFFSVFIAKHSLKIDERVISILETHLMGHTIKNLKENEDLEKDKWFELPVLFFQRDGSKRGEMPNAGPCPRPQGCDNS